MVLIKQRTGKEKQMQKKQMDQPAGRRRAGYNNELGKRSQSVYITQAPASLPEAALFYAQLGWPVVPLLNVRDGFCSCGRSVFDDRGNLVHKLAGQHPRTLHGSKDATTESDQITRWWTQWPDANIGTRKGNQKGVRVDPKKGGDATIQALQKRFTRLPPTPIVDIGDGGRHFHFKYTGDPIHATKVLGPGLEFIGEKTLLILPPSLHLTGEYYRWKEGCSQETSATSRLDCADHHFRDTRRGAQHLNACEKRPENLPQILQRRSQSGDSVAS